MMHTRQDQDRDRSLRMLQQLVDERAGDRDTVLTTTVLGRDLTAGQTLVGASGGTLRIDDVQIVDDFNVLEALVFVHTEFGRLTYNPDAAYRVRVGPKNAVVIIRCKHRCGQRVELGPEGWVHVTSQQKRCDLDLNLAEPGSVELHCPYDEEHGASIVEVDVARRWNKQTDRLTVAPDGSLHVHWSTDGDSGDFEGDGFICQTCTVAVDVAAASHEYDWV